MSLAPGQPKLLKDVIAAGVILNVISSLIIMFATYVIMPKVLDIDDIEEHPDWALATTAQQTQPGWQSTTKQQSVCVCVCVCVCDDDDDDDDDD